MPRTRPGDRHGGVPEPTAPGKVLTSDDDLGYGWAGSGGDKLTDASGQTTRWRGIYANQAALPSGQAGDFAITLA